MVLASKNPYIINTYAENEATLYSDSPKELKICAEMFEDAMLATGDILHIYEFGASVPGANIRKIENAAIESEMPKYMYYVAAYVEGADIGRLYRSIQDSGNQKYIDKMEDHIKEEGIVISQQNHTKE
jgi:hypothetical protein